MLEPVKCRGSSSWCGGLAVDDAVGPHRSDALIHIKEFVQDFSLHQMSISERGPLSRYA
jgi:hypothetical protein